jgi:Cupin-like domain
MTDRHVLHEINQAIEEISGITAADLTDDLLASDRPLVLRGLASDWPAVRHGLESADRLIEYLLGFDSGNVVTALHAPPEAAGRIFYNEDMTAFNFEYRRMALAAAVRQVRSHVDLPSPPSLYMSITGCRVSGNRTTFLFDTWGHWPASGSATRAGYRRITTSRPISPASSRGIVESSCSRRSS